MTTEPQSPAGGERGRADIEFFWDPICPFAWIASRWIHQVQARRDLVVDWRFISLRLLNADIDYDRHFPPEYEHGHTAGLRMLRVASAIRDEVGSDAMGPLYDAFGATVFDVDRRPGHAAVGIQPREWLGSRDHIAGVLTGLGHDPAYAEAADDEARTEPVRADTERALSMSGRDVGTPIIAFEPPDGPAFFGPVLSRVPSRDDAVRLWDTIVSLAHFPAFAELKRSLRERPQLRSMGVEPGAAGVVEDWRAGSRRWD